MSCCLGRIKTSRCLREIVQNEAFANPPPQPIAPSLPSITSPLLSPPPPAHCAVRRLTIEDQQAADTLPPRSSPDRDSSPVGLGADQGSPGRNAGGGGLSARLRAREARRRSTEDARHATPRSGSLGSGQPRSTLPKDAAAADYDGELASDWLPVRLVNFSEPYLAQFHSR